MKPDHAPEIVKEITPERVGTVLDITKRRLDFMQRKLARFDELKGTLTKEELEKLWDGLVQFKEPRDAMDNLLTVCLNRDGKI